MKRLYEKDEVTFSLVWIALYVVVMNIALQFCGGFDDLASKTAVQLIVPVICATALAAAATAWILKNGLTEKFGLCRFKGSRKAFLWFIPLIVMSCTNLSNGLGLTAPLAVSLLMMGNKAIAGYVEEIIFRGFLFRGMAKNNLRSAIIVSSVTFGAGHIVNLANTEDTVGVLLQISYAIVIGFLYTIIVYKGGSLWPCILSHMFVNGSSVFSLGQGPFTALVAVVFGQATPVLVQTCSAVLLMVISGGYALWLWKKA
ncbi:MAG: CPBP family intramembrane metalloprotease [Clostridia bacterium]|nr:CPBP family intramembrane metalloprotease [Clostridia bacterium]